MIQSVDSVELAVRLSGLAARGVGPPGGAPIRVFAQLNLADEASKFGIREPQVESSLARIAELAGIRLSGLMLIPPFERDPEAARPAFARLRELGERFRRTGLLPGDLELSMGMSHDYPVAIAEGATTVRVGTAIFGPRTP